MTHSLHESFQAATEEKIGSDRSFGFIFTAVFIIVGLWPLLNDLEPRWWALAVGAVFGLLAVLAPGLLRPLNRAWMAFGRLLHRIVSPIVIGLLYIVAVVPTGLALRVFGKDPLRLKADAAAHTYWIARTPPGPAADSFKNQF